MKTVQTLGAALSALALITAACAKEPNTPANSPRDDTTTTNASGTVTNSVATGKITGARCAREGRCNNVGAGQKYANEDACIREIGQNTSSDLNDSKCTLVVEKELNECLDEVTHQACNNPIDAISRIAACARNQLCQ